MVQGSSYSPTESFSVGNVVSASFQLYRAKAKEYLKIALAAVGWSLLPVLAIIAIALIAALIAGATRNTGTIAGVLVLAFVATIVLAVFCYAKSLTNSALISRLAFHEISDQPESLQDARRFVNSRKWSFLFTQLLVGLIVVGLVLVVYFVFGLLAVALAASGGAFSGGSGNAGLAIVLGILMLVLAIAAIVFFFWLGARLTGAEVPLAVEAQSSATQSVGRFWELTKGNVWRVFLVTFITFLITLPLYILAQFISAVPQAVILATLRDNPETAMAVNAISTLISYAVSLLLSLLVLPLWQIVKAVLYYDLRSRREGLGLQLRDR